MFRVLRILRDDRDWRLMSFAGLAGFALAFVATEIARVYDAPLDSLSVTLASALGALLGICIAGPFSTMRARADLREQNKRLDGAINNMIQGLCLFDAQNRLMVWNERYRTMYRLKPRDIWRGCSIRNLLDARIAAGTFPLDPTGYESQLRTALKRGETFTLTIELQDGRTMEVVNQPMASGGWVATHEDITERKRAQRELESTREFLDKVIENVPSPILVKDIPSFRYLLINRAAEKYLGVERANMIGKTAADVLPENTARLIDERDRTMVAAGAPVFFGEHAIVTPTNDTRVASATRLPVMGPDGKPQYLIIVVDDLTERKRQEQSIAHMRHHDPLTELPNRAAFKECIDATVDLAAKAGESFALLSLDIDRFKAVNDVYGHAVADALLREVAVRLESACAGAFLARVGGDEFSVITPTGAQPAIADALAGRIAAAFESELDVGGNLLQVRLTTGIAIFPQDGRDATSLIANADAALSRAKSDARGSIRFFEPEMDHELRQKRLLQKELRNALARDELTLHYQPQARIGGEIIGFEALARWHHPRLGLVPPSTFIPLAEESGMVMALGEWVLRSACREAASWPQPLHIAINLSPVQFQHGDLPSLVHQVLLETGLAPDRLELEITEGVLIGDFQRAVAILRRLKNLGVHIAMDDFGTGYSSLSYLQSFPFDKIKIDRAFIANLERNQQSATIVRAVIALGRGLDLPVLAEGVETEAQLKFLANESCDEIQGYLVGRPRPIGDYADMVGRAPAAWSNSRAAAG